MKYFPNLVEAYWTFIVLSFRIALMAYYTYVPKPKTKMLNLFRGTARNKYKVKQRQTASRQRQIKTILLKSFILFTIVAPVVIGIYHFAIKKNKLPNIPLIYAKTKVYIDPNALTSHLSIVDEFIKRHDSYEISSNPQSADISIVLEKQDEKCNVFYAIGLFPVVRFASTEDSIDFEQLKKLVTGEDTSYEYINISTFEDVTLKIMKIKDHPKKNLQSVGEKEQLLKMLEENQRRIALVPPSWLDARMKILEVDRIFPLDTDSKNSANSQLSFTEYLCTKKGNSDEFIKELGLNFYQDTLDKTRVATVIQTGVTAMARNVYLKMVLENDPAYISHKISDFLRSADLTHTSNEVSFAKNCKQSATTMSFCAKAEFIQTLVRCGIDLVELTGNHNNDWGYDANTYSQNLYKQNNISYFGGGANIEEARAPYIVDIKGTKIGFLGYNWYDSKGGGSARALATSSLPGANPYDEKQVQKDIEQLRQQVDIVIVDVQFQECWAYSTDNSICYRPDAVKYQQEVFRQLREWGADIVVGTQAHQPQGFEINEKGSIFYGLGNLFFDQIVYTGTREEIMIKHYFYNGKHLTTRVYTAFYGAEYQPYLTTGAERTALLTKLFNASGWRTE